MEMIKQAVVEALENRYKNISITLNFGRLPDSVEAGEDYLFSVFVSASAL